MVRSLCSKSGAVEQYAFVGELTSRDKDHVSKLAIQRLLYMTAYQASRPFNSCNHNTFCFRFATPHQKANCLYMVRVCGGVATKRPPISISKTSIPRHTFRQFFLSFTCHWCHATAPQLPNIRLNLEPPSLPENTRDHTSTTVRVLHQTMAEIP